MAIVRFEYNIYSAFLIVFATLFPVFPLGKAPETVKLYLSTSLTMSFDELSLLGKSGGTGKRGNNGVLFEAPGTTGFAGAAGGFGGTGCLDWPVSCGNTKPIIREKKITVIITCFIINFRFLSILLRFRRKFQLNLFYKQMFVHSLLLLYYSLQLYRYHYLTWYLFPPYN